MGLSRKHAVHAAGKVKSFFKLKHNKTSFKIKRSHFYAASAFFVFALGLLMTYVLNAQIARQRQTIQSRAEIPNPELYPQNCDEPGDSCCIRALDDGSPQSYCQNNLPCKNDGKCGGCGQIGQPVCYGQFNDSTGMYDEICYAGKPYLRFCVDDSSPNENNKECGSAGCCVDQGGTCQEPANTENCSDGHYISNYCGGGANRRCCVPGAGGGPPVNDPDPQDPNPQDPPPQQSCEPFNLPDRAPDLSFDEGKNTISWPSYPGASRYEFRFNMQGNGWSGDCNYITAYDFCENKLSSNSLNGFYMPGGNHKAWYHVVNACGQSSEAVHFNINVKDLGKEWEPPSPGGLSEAESCPTRIPLIADKAETWPGFHVLAWPWHRYALHYQLRIDDTSNEWRDSCTDLASGDYCSNNHKDNFINYDWKIGHTYKLWYHVVDTCAPDRASGAISTTITVKEKPQQDKTITISGHVYDAAGKGVANVDVSTCSFGTVKTDSTGLWKVDGVSHGAPFCARVGDKCPFDSYRAMNNRSGSPNNGCGNRYTYEFQMAGLKCGQGETCGADNSNENKNDLDVDNKFDFKAGSSVGGPNPSSNPVVSTKPSNNPIISVNPPVVVTGPNPSSGVPSWVCAGSPDNICNPSTTMSQPPPGTGPIISTQPNISQTPRSPSGTPEPCLNPQDPGFVQQIQDWVQQIRQTILNYISAILGNPTGPTPPPPTITPPCIRV